MGTIEKILFTSIEDDFKTHLEDGSGNRILFSAPFGTGKTTFLIDFFTKHENYNCIHLYPINYSVASNDDIFELIKYDIFYELLGRHREEIKLAKEEFSMLLTSQNFLLGAPDLAGIIKSIIKNTSKIGKASTEIIDVLKAEINKYVKYHKGQNINEHEEIKKYLESFENKLGLTELDEFTILINNLVERLKGDGSAKTVLIIDDLDRMDPEHIFRIFNVFSAHFDVVKDQNKFGFDHIIFVCDISNIQAIYEHRYGTAVNFSGYINKFYSKGVYFFDNKSHIDQKLKVILTSFTPIEQSSVNENEPAYKYRLQGTHSNFYETILFILRAFLFAEQLDLRSLISMGKLKLNDYKFYDPINKGRYNSALKYDFLVLVQFFEQLFGGLASFDKKLLKLSSIRNSDPKGFYLEDSYYDQSWGRWIVEYCLPFITETHVVKYQIEPDSKKQTWNNFDLHYTIHQEARDYYYSLDKITRKGGDVEISLTELNLFQLLQSTLELVIKQNIVSKV